MQLEPQQPPASPTPQQTTVSNSPPSSFSQNPSPTPPPKRTQKERPHDPICIGICLRDPMYDIASQHVKQTIEVEESRILEQKIGELYKNESGRSRGWVKSALDTFFQPRSASGGSLPAKQAFVWSSIFTDKSVSALLDFLCLAKGVQLAVWNQAEHCVGIWPAADSRDESSKKPILLHYSAEGAPMPHKTSVFETGWSLRAALSVEHSLEKLTLDELASVAQKIGMNAEGLAKKKADRVRQIASEQTRLRLQS